MKAQNARQIIPKIISVIAGILLAGCGTASVPAMQRVDVPVPVPCVKAADVPQRPDYAVEKLAPAASDGEKVLALASDWPRGLKYEEQLEAVIAGCSEAASSLQE